MRMYIVNVYSPYRRPPWSRITIERHGLIIIPRRYYDKVRLKLLYIDDCENGLHEFDAWNCGSVTGMFLKRRISCLSLCTALSWLSLRCWGNPLIMFLCRELNECIECTQEWECTNWSFVAGRVPPSPDALLGHGLCLYPPFYKPMHGSVRLMSTSNRILTYVVLWSLVNSVCVFSQVSWY